MSTEQSHTPCKTTAMTSPMKKRRTRDWAWDEGEGGREALPEDVMLQLGAQGSAGEQGLTGPRGEGRTFPQRNATFKGPVVGRR